MEVGGPTSMHFCVVSALWTSALSSDSGSNGLLLV